MFGTDSSFLFVNQTTPIADPHLHITLGCKPDALHSPGLLGVHEFGIEMMEELCEELVDLNLIGVSRADHLGF